MQFSGNPLIVDFFDKSIDIFNEENISKKYLHGKFLEFLQEYLETNVIEPKSDLSSFMQFLLIQSALATNSDGFEYLNRIREMQEGKVCPIEKIEEILGMPAVWRDMN